MITSVIQLLESGPRQLLQAPVICTRDTLENIWNEGNWKSHVRDSGKEYINVLSDASDCAGCTWVSTQDWPTAPHRSKSASTILQRGSSRHPHLHRLCLRIYDATRILRHDCGWCVGWIPREQNKAADAGSKLLRDWQITPKAFNILSEEFHFTMDAFASQAERPSASLPFCSRYICSEALGDTRVVSWDNHHLWCFPPATLLMVSLAIRKWKLSSNTRMVLCIPAYHTADYWPVVWNAPWHSYRSSPATNFFKVTGLSRDGKTLETRKSTIGYSLFLF